MEVDLNKPFEEKNIIEKHTIDNQFRIGTALLDLESKIKSQAVKIDALEEAMQFFSEWYNTTQRANILVPEYLSIMGTDNNNPPKIIL